MLAILCTQHHASPVSWHYRSLEFPHDPKGKRRSPNDDEGGFSIRKVERVICKLREAKKQTSLCTVVL